MMYLLIFCAGGAGATLRFTLDTWFKTRFTPRVPLGIFLINVTGSLLLGLLTGVMSRTQPSAATENLELVLGLGFLGGYTTFSTALLEAVTHPSTPGTLVLTLLQSFCALCAATLGLLVGSIATV